MSIEKEYKLQKVLVHLVILRNLSRTIGKNFPCISTSNQEKIIQIHTTENVVMNQLSNFKKS